LKILFSIPWFYPAYKAGGPIRSVVNLVQALESDFDINIVTGDKDLNEAQKLPNVKTDTWTNYGSHAKVYYTSTNMNLFERLAFLKKNQTDVLFVNGIYSLYFSILPIVFSHSGRVIMSARGMLHTQALNQKKWKKKIYMIFLKMLVKKFNIEFHATDNEERLFIEKAIGSQTKVWVAANLPTLIPFTTIEKKEGVLRLLTVALIGPMKNYKMVLEALKSIKGNVVYDICGPVYFPEYWNECLSVIATLPSNIKVNYHGAIPPNQIASFYQNAHVFICPSQSENYGHSFFEALTCGRPIISSHNTPWLNLEQSQSGINVEINTFEVEKAIQFFIDMYNIKFQHWSDSAKKYASDKTDLDQIKQSYIKMFSDNL
jgi:glycosyltransferase involved in cell wall biosynthesis